MTEQEPTTLDELLRQIVELRDEHRGQVKERQRQLTWHRRQIAFIAVAGLAGLALVAYRSELADDTIRNDRYNACMLRVAQLDEYQKGRVEVMQLIFNLNPDASNSAKAAVLNALSSNVQRAGPCVR